VRVIVHMARENTIVLSDNEISKLKDTREQMFGSSEVPYGVVVDRLCSEWEDSSE